MPAAVFPLIPSRRGVGIDVTGRPSRRRGSGSDVASTRPYRRGDAIRLVDWAASARLSTARGNDEFVVRDHFADDAVRVVIVLDRSPSMALYPEDLPWLRKPEAVRTVASTIVASASSASALLGFAESGSVVNVEHPRRDRAVREALEDRVAVGVADGPADSVDRAVALLARRASRVPAGTFVFVVSDFFPAPGADTLRSALAAGWDLVPVVVQDPVWERSFPEVAGVTLPLADPVSGTVALVRLSGRQARERREGNERRAEQLSLALDANGLDPVLVTSSDPRAIHAAFLRWADQRVARGRGYR